MSNTLTLKQKVRITALYTKALALRGELFGVTPSDDEVLVISAALECILEDIGESADIIIEFVNSVSWSHPLAVILDE